jgi:hypothetical protein
MPVWIVKQRFHASRIHTIETFCRTNHQDPITAAEPINLIQSP